MKKNIIDSVIDYISPEAGARRARARMVGNVLRKYDGADRGRRTAGWHTTAASANAEIKGQLATLRNRSRDLNRNNPYAAKATQVIVANTIGTGIIPQIKDKASARSKRYQEAWKAWGESTFCDFDQRHDMYGLQALVMRTVVESGECLVRRVNTRQLKDGVAPIKIQVLEPDYLDTSRDGLRTDGDTTIIQGIEYNKGGEVVAYWLYSQHPGDNAVAFLRNNLISQRVPASEIIHVFRQNRPGQGRGVPWCAPVIIRMQDFDEYMDATIVKQKVAASFAGFIKEPDGSLMVGGTQQSISEKIEPGALEILPPGKDIVFPSPPSVNEIGVFSQEVLHSIAAGFGITYESMTGDYSRVNFSSGRMGWIEFHRNIEDWRWNMFIPQFCAKVFDWFAESAIVAGIDQLSPSSVSWTAPRREMIDPGKELNSMKDGIRAGLISYPESLRSLGYDPDEVMTEISESNKKLDELELKLDSDPRNINKAGAFQMAPGTNVAPDDAEDVEEETDSEEKPVRYFVDEQEQLYKQTADGIEKIST
jgi:lambda family phage portal protein